MLRLNVFCIGHFKTEFKLGLEMFNTKNNAFNVFSILFSSYEMCSYKIGRESSELAMRRRAL